MSGYLFLSLGLFSLGCLGILHKVADRVGCRPVPMTLCLFGSAFLLSSQSTFLVRGEVDAFTVPGPVVLTAALCGVLASVAIVTFQRAVHLGTITTSWLLINLSTLLPATLSILVYGEEIDWKSAGSLVMAIAALILLWIDWTKTLSAQDRSNPRLAQSRRT